MRVLLHELGLPEDAYRLDEIAAFIPSADDAESDVHALPDSDAGPSEGVPADSSRDDRAEREAASLSPLLNDEGRVGPAGWAPSVAEPKDTADGDLDREVERSAEASTSLGLDARDPHQSPSSPLTRTTLEVARILLGSSYAPLDSGRSDAPSQVSYEDAVAPSDPPPRSSSEAEQDWTTAAAPSPADADLAWTKRGEA